MQLNCNITLTIVFVFHNIYLGINNIYIIFISAAEAIFVSTNTINVS